MRGAFVILLLVLTIDLQCVLQSTSSSGVSNSRDDRNSDQNQYVNSRYVRVCFIH